MPAVNVSDFKAFSRDLRAAEPATRRAMRRQLRAAGELVAAEARALNISKQTKISVSLAGSNVAVVAKGPAITALEEGDGTAGSWRHPVWGNHDNWVSQQRHPYLKPALDDNRDAAIELIAECIDEGFRVAAGG